MSGNGQIKTETRAFQRLLRRKQTLVKQLRASEIGPKETPNALTGGALGDAMAAGNIRHRGTGLVFLQDGNYLFF